MVFEGKTDDEFAGELGLSKNAVQEYKSFITKWLACLPGFLDGENWLVRLKKGDEKIWEQVYNKHKSAIYSYAISLTKRNVEASEDLGPIKTIPAT